MNDLEKLRNLLQSLKNVKNDDIYRSKAYSIYVIFLLSTEIFKNNIDVKDFFEKNPEFLLFIKKYKMELKDYLFNSRTVLVGRFIRIIQKAEIADLKAIMKVIQNIAFFEAKNTNLINNKLKDNEENYYDSLLKQFKRGN
ncbi:hypothetical protein F9B85_10140 [Heliorestis acidaminivorans]|uniref:Uncharacterized protein n=1 Tax=Heliorestis acidaminivorans TaxID=553427 RepID=A0A6I0EY37_9FIRM|nr:hypothetical protein [Heliorestis acidaminivorans]KAB2952163.1 hypothetical protein F9B85_10140 [Heliorestis acidaminivorans]